MNPAQRAPVRSTTVVRPTVTSPAALRALEASMRRLGVDEGTARFLTGRAGRRPARTA